MFNSLHVLGTNWEHLTMCPFSTPIKHCNSARKLNKVLASKGPTVHNPWNMERAIAGENSSANDCFWENGVNIPRRRFKVHSLTPAPRLHLGLQTMKEGGGRGHFGRSRPNAKKGDQKGSFWGREVAGAEVKGKTVGRPTEVRARECRQGPGKPRRGQWARARKGGRLKNKRARAERPGLDPTKAGTE